MTRHSSLPVRTPDLLHTVGRFTQATSSQLRRLHYPGLTPQSQKTLSSYNLARLVELGKLRRIWGVHHGHEPEYVYTLPGSTAKPDDHTLDVTELYVRLAEIHGLEVDYTPEPWLDYRVGTLTMTPDAYLELSPERRSFIEMDLNTERPARLRKKMRHYYNAYLEWDDEKRGLFPKVIWVVHMQARARDIRLAIKQQPEPRLFVVRLFDEVIERLR